MISLVTICITVRRGLLQKYEWTQIWWPSRITMNAVRKGRLSCPLSHLSFITSPLETLVIAVGNFVLVRVAKY